MYFFFNDTATTEIYTLSLHDALPICRGTLPGHGNGCGVAVSAAAVHRSCLLPGVRRDRKSTRLNSSHLVISYAVFCLKKKKIMNKHGKTSQPPQPRYVIQSTSYSHTY